MFDQTILAYGTNEMQEIYMIVNRNPCNFYESNDTLNCNKLFMSQLQV